MPPTAIEIVEPTLVSEAGHCAALFQGLRAAAPDLDFRLWIDRRARLPGWAGAHTRLQPHFLRRLRKPQAFLLYRRLLASGAPIFVPTAGYFDLRALELAARGTIAPQRVFLYFHKLRASAARQRALARVARRQPALQLFGTSEQIVARLREAGFTSAQRVLPVLAGTAVPPVDGTFRRLLSAGAARADKGFTHIVDLVELLERSGADLPITVQASGDHYGRYDERTQAELARLRRSTYRGLTLLEHTLSASEYAALFPGSVCLQPYEPAEYADKMSAVTFDALRVGAPVVTRGGTTMAGMVEGTRAGVVVAGASAAELLAAVKDVVASYGEFHQAALAAGAPYRDDASWAPLVTALRAAI